MDKLIGTAFWGEIEMLLSVVRNFSNFSSAQRDFREFKTNERWNFTIQFETNSELFTIDRDLIPSSEFFFA